MFFDENGILNTFGNNRNGNPSIYRHGDDTSTSAQGETLMSINSHSNSYKQYRYFSEFSHYDDITYIASAGYLYKLDVLSGNTNFATLDQNLENLGSITGKSYDYTDMAISPNGNIYLTSNTELQVYDITNETFTESLAYPDDAKDGFAQIAFDEYGELYFIAEGLAGGLRSWNKSFNSNWSNGVLIDGSVNSNSVISSLSSELLIDSNGAPHLVYMNDGALYYLEEKSNGWESQFNTTIPSQTNNHGLDFVLDSANKPHLTWVDHSNGSTYYTTFNELTSIWESQIVRVFMSWNVNYIKSVSIIVDDYDDPYIFSSVGSGTTADYSQINYLGKYSQSIDVNDVPGDADGDGICDALDQATLEYDNFKSSS